MATDKQTQAILAEFRKLNSEASAIRNVLTVILGELISDMVERRGGTDAAFAELREFWASHFDFARQTGQDNPMKVEIDERTRIFFDVLMMSAGAFHRSKKT